MKVKEAMHKGVEWVDPETPIADVAKLMQRHDVGSIPVGQDDKLVGMVTDRDIAIRGLTMAHFDAKTTNARDVMSSGIHCCRADDDLQKAVTHMKTLGVRRLPVIDAKKRMVGMLSLGDVTHAAGRDVTADYVKAVSAHH